MQNNLRGVDLIHSPLWTARQISETQQWESTGIKESGFIIHVDFKAALQWNLVQYTETHTIQGVLDNEYRIAIPHNAAAITILDAIAKELGYA